MNRALRPLRCAPFPSKLKLRVSTEALGEPLERGGFSRLLVGDLWSFIAFSCLSGTSTYNPQKEKKQQTLPEYFSRESPLRGF